YTGTPDLSTTSSMMTFNGDDAITLEKKSGDKIDIFGVIGEYSKNKGWKAGENETVKKTLVRNPSVKKGVSSSTAGFPELGTEWTMYDQNTIFLGSHTTDY
ncbi:MAG TPA: hypothetical protein VFC69_07260, partial [Dysgonamonadaceae bacterium]|nr:hypothetical protein [Dysgonamonadaceae bacterium]